MNFFSRKLYDVEMEGVPPFIYQILLISRKGYKKNILMGILEYFSKATNEDNEIRFTNSKTLSKRSGGLTFTYTYSSEGTSMLHLTFAVRQDQDLGNELVKIMKNNKTNQLDVFGMASLLSVARIHRLQDTVSYFI